MPFAYEWALQLSAKETVLHRGPGHICIHIARLTECGKSDPTHWFCIEQKINGSKRPQHVSHAFTHFLWAVIRDQIFWDAVTSVNNWNDEKNHSRYYIFLTKWFSACLYRFHPHPSTSFLFFTQTQESTHTFFLAHDKVSACGRWYSATHWTIRLLLPFFISPMVHDFPVQQG